MCIACGGTCGGAGDIVLPSLVIGAVIIVQGVRASREARETKEEGDDTALMSESVLSDRSDSGVPRE